MAGQVVQIIGSLLILVPFGLSQLGKARPRSWSYLTVNLAGSAALAADAAVSSQWGFLLLEGTWALVSLGGLCARVAPSIKPIIKGVRATAGLTRSHDSPDGRCHV